MIISPKSEGKRQLTVFHFLKLLPHDLIISYRGVYWLFQLALSLGANFCTRISYRQWRVANKFYLSGKKGQIGKIKSPQSLRKCFEMALDNTSIKVRMLRIELESGETEILVTFLMDMEKYPYDLFAELYHLRWPVEEEYKTIKYRLQVDNFSGKSVHSMHQDFHEKMFSKNLVAAIAITTRNEILKESETLTFVL